MYMNLVEFFKLYKIHINTKGPILKFYFKNYSKKLVWNIIFSMIYKMFVRKKISFFKINIHLAIT